MLDWNAQMTTASPSQFTGYAAAWTIVFVWSFWLVVSRVAQNSGLTIYDLAALRYGLASLVALPLGHYFNAGSHCPCKAPRRHKEAVDIPATLPPCCAKTGG